MSTQPLSELAERYQQNKKSLVFSRYADALLQEGRIDEAIQICQQGVEDFPEYLSGYLMLGQCLHKSGDLETARKQYEKVLQLDPRCIGALKALGYILDAQNKKGLAAERYADILSLGNHDLRIRNLDDKSKRDDKTQDIQSEDGKQALSDVEKEKTEAMDVESPEGSGQDLAEGISGKDLEDSMDKMVEELEASLEERPETPQTEEKERTPEAPHPDERDDTYDTGIFKAKSILRKIAPQSKAADSKSGSQETSPVSEKDESVFKEPSEIVSPKPEIEEALKNDKVSENGLTGADISGVFNQMAVKSGINLEDTANERDQSQTPETEDGSASPSDLGEAKKSQDTSLSGEDVEAALDFLGMPTEDEPASDPDEMVDPSEIASSSEEATETLAEIFFKQGLKEKALEIYRQLLEKDPSNQEIANRITDIESSIDS
jgi:tetratricopeptide (TPR) repeat protein